MRKLIVFAILLVTVVTGYAQNQSVDNFIVGPFEVDYYGLGDYNYRLRKGIDINEYFGLKNDTIRIVQEKKAENKPVKRGIQINAFMSIPRFTMAGNSNLFGVSGNWKQQFGEIVYLNAGLSLGFSYGKYNYNENKKPCYRKETMIEVGIPLSVEFTKLDYKKSSVYAGVGLVPTFYGTIKADETSIEGKEQKGKKNSGFLISPRIDFGGYIPLSNQILRIGIYGEYKINCTGDVNIYKKRIGRAFVGANVGIVF